MRFAARFSFCFALFALVTSAAVPIAAQDSVDAMEFWLEGRGYDSSRLFPMTITARQVTHDAGTPFETTVTKFDGETSFDVAQLDPPLQPGAYRVHVRAHSLANDLWTEQEPSVVLYVFESLPTVTSVEYWIDQDVASAVSIPLPADGAWDEDRELFSAVIPVAGLAMGDHELFLRASDTRGFENEPIPVDFHVFQDFGVVVEQMEVAIGSPANEEPLAEDPRVMAEADDGLFDEPREAFNARLTLPPNSPGTVRVFARARRPGVAGKPFGPWAFVDLPVHMFDNSAVQIWELYR